MYGSHPVTPIRGVRTIDQAPRSGLHREVDGDWSSSSQPYASAPCLGVPAAPPTGHPDSVASWSLSIHHVKDLFLLS